VKTNEVFRSKNEKNGQLSIKSALIVKFELRGGGSLERRGFFALGGVNVRDEEGNY